MKKMVLILGLISMALVVSSRCYANEWAISYDGSDLYDSAKSVLQTSDGGYVVAGWTEYLGSVDHDFWVLRLASDGTTIWGKSYDRAGYDYGSSIQETFDQHGDPNGHIVAGRSGFYSGGPYDFWVLKLDNSGNISWQKAYDNDGGNDYAYFIQQTFDGLGKPNGYVVAGKTKTGFDGSSDDLWVLKLHPDGWDPDGPGGDPPQDGVIAWQNSYDGEGDNYAHSIQQTFDGLGEPNGYVVAGKTGSDTSSVDVWVLKLDDNGNVAWEKRYGGNETDIACSIQQTSDSGYVVAGYTNSFGAGDYDFWVLKLYPDGWDPDGPGGVPPQDGIVAWERTYGGNDDPDDHRDAASSIRQTTDGGYIVAGDTQSFGVGSADFWVLKLHPDGWDPDGPGGNPPQDGVIAWERTYGGSVYDTASSIRQTTDGGYIVAGDTWSFDVASSDFWVLKLDQDGQIPDCDIARASQATVSSESVEGQDTSATVSIAEGVILSTDVSLWDASARMTVICGPNQAPVLDPIGDKMVDEGNLLEFSISAWDPNVENVLTYAANSLPPGANFNPTTRTFSWIPGYEQAGVYPGVLFTVTDNCVPPLSDSETITITVVDVFPAPVIDKIGNSKCYPGEKIRIKGSGFGDIQGDSVVHIGPKTYDSTSRKIKLWTDIMIKIKIPFKQKDCSWFKHGGGEYRKRKVWVTVYDEGVPVDSNTERIKVLKPHECDNPGGCTACH
ncbi:MAG: hypothetical protein JRF37_05150 [Deltaproteobacteria bacterium]|nr:hypothetical protein [Deltaproteobacteria bacterium]